MIKEISKLLYLSVILTTLLFTACEDQELPEAEESEIYFKLYGGYYNETLTGIDPLSDASVLMSSYINADDTNMAFIFKTLPDGMSDWEVTLPWTFSKALDILYVESKNLVYTAIAREVNTDTSMLVLAAFSINGTLKDSVSRYIEETTIEDIKLSYTSETGLRMYTQLVKENTSADIDSNYIVVYDYQSDSLIESSKYTIAQRMNGELSVLAYSENETYITVSVYEAASGDISASTPLDIRLLYFNEGGIVWDKTFGGEGSFETVADLQLIDDEIIVVGNYRTQLNSTQQIILYKIDQEGFMTDDSYPVNFGIDEFGNDIEVKSVTLNSDTNLVFTGSMETGDGTTDIFFLETTLLGENIRYNAFGPEGQQEGENIGKFILCNPNTGGYFLAGDLEPITNTDICIFSLDEEGDWVY